MTSSFGGRTMYSEKLKLLIATHFTDELNDLGVIVAGDGESLKVVAYPRVGAPVPLPPQSLDWARHDEESYNEELAKAIADLLVAALRGAPQ